MKGQARKTVRKTALRRVVKNLGKTTPADGPVLRLFVAGATTKSHQAILRLRSFCDEHVAERFVLQVIDIYQSPELARDWQIVATPTLIRALPAPERRFIGNIADLTSLLSDTG